MILDDEYKIESDPLNVILYKKYVPQKSKDGSEPKEYWQAAGYFRTYGQAIKQYAKIKTHTVPHELQAIAELEKNLTSLIESLAIYQACRRCEIVPSAKVSDDENCE